MATSSQQDAARPEAAGRKPILELRNVSISYFVRAGELKVVPNISLTLYEGEALGLVGESGCGKSTVAFAIMNYLGGAGRVTGGQILFEGHDMTKMSEAELRKIRGGRMAMVYQDPMSSLNPVIPIGKQLMEVPIIHSNVSEAEAPQARPADAEGSQPAGPGAHHDALSAPAVRRPAAACRHRHGA